MEKTRLDRRGGVAAASARSLHLLALLALCLFAGMAAPVPAALLVDLDAEGLAPGTFTAWPNAGTLGGDFVTSTPMSVPTVETVGGRKAVTFGGAHGIESSFYAPAALAGSNPFTIAVWGYNPALAANESLVSWSDRFDSPGMGGYAAFGWGTNIAEGAAYYRYGTDLAYATPPSASTWHHIALTFGGTADSQVKVYVDGQLDNSVALTGVNNQRDHRITVGTMRWTGHTPTPFNGPFSGSLARVQIYDQALGAEEVFILSGGVDAKAPLPDPATFATPPTPLSEEAIRMTATTGSDVSGPVEYFFDETTGGTGAGDSGWQTSPSYTDSGLAWGTLYTYRVRMRDSVGNLTAWSTPLSAATLNGPDGDPPTPNPASFSAAPRAEGADEITMTATAGTDFSVPVEYYFTETSGNDGGDDSGWVTSPAYVDAGLSPATTYTYTVRMRDSRGNTGIDSPAASAVTEAFSASDWQGNSFFLFGTGDTHYTGKVPAATYDITGEVMAKTMNALPGAPFPAALGGGTVGRPRGVLVTGDLTDGYGVAATEWAAYAADFGVNGEGLLDFPVYDLWGNHDYHLGPYVKQRLTERNAQRSLPTYKSPGSTGHYSWDMDDVHFVNVDLFPGNTSLNSTGDPDLAFNFLKDDLNRHVGTSGRPVVILQHYSLPGWWSSSQTLDFANFVKNFNVVAVIHGHTHGTKFYEYTTSTLTTPLSVYDVGSPSQVPVGKFMVFQFTPTKLRAAICDTSGTWVSTKEKSITFPAAPAEIAKGPYLLYGNDPTRMTVHWQTATALPCQLAWGTTSSCFDGQTTTTEYNASHQHKYTLADLTPGRKYYYRLTVPGRAGYVTGSLRAAPDAATKNVKFFAHGDTRTNIAEHNLVCGAMMNTVEADPGFQTFALHSGDWSSGDTEAAWAGEYFARSSTRALDLVKSVAVMGCMGNHEGAGVFFKQYWPYDFQGGRFYHSFDYGPVHVAVVDNYASFAPGSAQHTWLTNDLAASTREWKVILLHEPGWSAYGTSGHPNNANVQNYIQPLCKTYGVDLVFAGHNHWYSRAVVDGVQHITAGAAGAPLYDVNLSAPNIVSAEKTYHHCEVTIRDQELSYQALRPNGSLIDSFTLSHAVPDTEPPTPDPAAFSLPPHAASDEAIAMTAVPGVDESGPVEYLFEETAGASGGTDSGWQTSPAYTDDGLLPGTVYAYTVKMRDGAGNVGGASPAASARTDARTTGAGKNWKKY